MGSLYRAQILLEPEQHRALTEIAQREGRSLSDIVREIVRQHLTERGEESQRQRAREALEALTRFRKHLEKQYGVLPGDLLEQIRAERGEELERVWRGEP